MSLAAFPHSAFFESCLKPRQLSCLKPPSMEGEDRAAKAARAKEKVGTRIVEMRTDDFEIAEKISSSESRKAQSGQRRATC